MTHHRSAFFAAVLCALVLFAPSNGFSQSFQPPNGESVQGKIIYNYKHAHGDYSTFRDVWTGKCIYHSSYIPSTHSWQPPGGTKPPSPSYCAPPDLRIVDVLEVTKGASKYELVVLSNGTVINYSVGQTNLGTINLSTNESPKKLIGDALYTLTTQNIFVSRDTAKTWTIDTTGLGGQPQDIAVDTSQFVYAVRYNGSFRQAPDTNIWKAMTPPALASWNKIFVDRLDRLYLAGEFNQHALIYRSLDLGATWAADTVGLGGTSAFSFGDDAYGNVYVVTAQSSYTNAGDQIYRSNGTAWTRIDLPITGSNMDNLHQREIFTALAGDTALIATSIYGVFSSADQGATWTESNDGIAANYFYGLVQTPSKRMLASTNLGIFGINPADTAWQKTYPQTGYLGGQPLFRDNTRAIYTSGPLVVQPDFATNPYPPRMTMKSTDGGVTWQPDTLGLALLSHISSFLFFVDETGTQHLASFSGGTTPSSIYVKLPAQPWAGDTMGFATNENTPQSFGSDGNGSLWLSVSSQTIPTLWRRTVTGGAWTSDTLGLGTEILNSFAAAKNGAVYAGGFTGVWKRSGLTWMKLPPPSGLFTTEPAFSISIDSTGALIAGYQHFDANYNSVGDGVFATTNDGKTWTNLQHVDTTTFKQFVSYGDTTYGISYYDGIFIFTTGATGSVQSEQSQATFDLKVRPNPSSGKGEISFTLSERNMIRITILDILGNEILSPIQGVFDEGKHRTSFDLSSLPTGTYYCRAQFMGTVETVKLVIER